MELIIPALAAAGSALIWLWIIRHYDRLEPEPLKTLLFVGFMGGLISVIPAGPLNSGVAYLLNTRIGAEDSSFLQSLFLYLFVGFNEEVWKAAAVLLLVRKHPDFNEPIDGMIYALTVALGFAAFENANYILRYGLGIIVSRSLLSVPAHLAFAAIWGYGFTRAKFLIPGHKYAATMAPYIIWAGLAHAVFNLILTRSGPGALLWVIILMVFLLGYARKKLTYLLSQSPFQVLDQCPECKTVNPEGSSFCGECGTDLQLDFYQICKKCRTRFGKSARYCPECGHIAGADYHAEAEYAGKEMAPLTENQKDD